MECTVRVVDESPEGQLKSERALRLLRQATVEHIIRVRIKDEVEKYNKKRFDKLRMLVQPSLKEKVLNRKKARYGKEVNLEEQIEVAIKAFRENQFFILINDKQYENLADRIILEENTKISFIKLVPLVGG